MTTGKEGKKVRNEVRREYLGHGEVISCLDINDGEPCFRDVCPCPEFLERVRRRGRKRR